MKKMKYLIPILTLLFVFVMGCTKWDNFDEPNSGIEGRLIDAGTGEQLMVKSPGGGTIRLLQQDEKYANPAPIDVEFMAEGKYKHTMLFSGTYKTFPRDGAFKYLGDTLTVVANAGEIAKQDFEVVPYFRLSASATDSTITYTITAPETTTEKMQEIIFMVNSYEIVNESVSSNTTGYFVNLWKQDVSNVLDSEILGVERTFTINWSDTHLPKGEYYFRVGARIGSIAKYNYSPVVKATVN